MNHVKRLLGLALILVLVGGCALLAGGASSSLAGEWRLTAGTADGTVLPIVPGSEPTLTVTDDKASGRAGCNIYGGTITSDGDRVSFSALQMTEMACDEPRMASESAYLAALAVVATTRRTGSELRLTGPLVDLQYTAVAPTPDRSLLGVDWTLESLLSGATSSSVAGDRATLRIDEDGAVSGSTGCRSFTGHASVTGAAVIFSQLVTDDRACDTALQAQDEHILAVLGGSARAAVSGDHLTLSAPDGLGLAFTAFAAPEDQSSSG